MILKKGTKIHVHLDTGFAGSEERSNYILSRDYDEDELLTILHQMAIENAQMYGIENAAEMTDDELEEAEEEGIEVSWDISGWYDIYDEEKHSGYVYTGHPEFEEF